MFTYNTFFTFFASLALLAAFFVISSTNPIHSVFFLILVFCSSAALFFLFNADFLALIFLVVYVGAIAVLFLFVVMMLNLHTIPNHDHVIRYLPIGCFIGILFLLNAFFIFNDIHITTTYTHLSYINWSTFLYPISTLHIFGTLLYTYYFPYFLIASLILFVAMLGAIVLTAHPSHAVKRQDINLQLERDFNKTIILVS